MVTKYLKIIMYETIKPDNPPGRPGTRVLQPISRVAKNLCRNRVRYLRQVHTEFKVKIK